MNHSSCDTYQRLACFAIMERVSSARGERGIVGGGELPWLSLDLLGAVRRADCGVYATLNDRLIYRYFALQDDGGDADAAYILAAPLI